MRSLYARCQPRFSPRPKYARDRFSERGDDARHRRGRLVRASRRHDHVASGDYELIVFGTAPTGHTLQLFRTPLAMAGWLRAPAESRRRMLPADRVENDEIVWSLAARIDVTERRADVHSVADLEDVAGMLFAVEV